MNSVRASEKLFPFLSKAGMLSPDGRCKTFDALANGYVRSDGVVVVILSNCGRTEVFLESAVSNQDGLSNGLTAPSGAAQKRLLHAAYKKGQLMHMLETHGTGTVLGG